VTCPTTGALNPGCRALRFDYGTSGSANGRLVNAWLDIYNPDKTGGAGMDSVNVATYTYDANGRLAKVTDPRSNLSTEYGYNTLDHLTSVKPAGQVPYQLNYVTVHQREKLDTVKRDRPAGDPTGGTATLAKFVYDMQLSGAGLPDLTAGSVARWNQKSVPTNGFAVFGPDHQLGATITADDWQYADLQYTDASGYTINTAKYGAGDWQYTATDYNDQGNVVRELDERALRLVIDNQMPSGATVDQPATLTIYNGDITNAASDALLTPAGTLVTDTYGPARFAALKDGSVKWVRTHKHTDFDQLAPNAGINPDTTLPYRLATTETTSAFDPGTGTDEVISRTVTDYGSPVTGDADGWALGRAGKAVIDANPTGPRDETAGDIVKVTRYDAEGRVIETRQPESNGADAGTRKTVYYTAAASSIFGECGSKPQWAGLACKVYPAAVPSSSAGTGVSLPTITTGSFTYLLQPRAVVERSASVTRTGTTSYLLDGRIQTSMVVVTGLVGATPTTEKEVAYDPATGDVTVLTARAADGTTRNVTIGRDNWGRVVTYQPSGEQSAVGTYDSAGRIRTLSDTNGATQYTYDATDASGRQERRGLLTGVQITTAVSSWSSTGAYDAAGTLTVEKLPGGITRTSQLDNAGEPIGLRYTGQVTTVEDDGSTTVDPAGGWLSWSIDNDVDGKVAHEWTPDGVAFTGAPANGDPNDVGDAVPYDRTNSYDSASRLVRTQARTAPVGGDLSNPSTTACTSRSYGFDRNSNRASTVVTSGDGACPEAGSGGSTVTIARVFDSADRPVTGASPSSTYNYDELGRTTAIPASDTAGSADLTIGYFDNDAARTIQQGDVTAEFSLDPIDRQAIENVTVEGYSG
jgi:YD repeat-containing protein